MSSNEDIPGKKEQLDQSIPRHEKVASATWRLAVMALAIFTGGYQAALWMNRDLVRYGDPVTIVGNGDTYLMVGEPNTQSTKSTNPSEWVFKRR